jgi:hypothetical protein
MGGHTKTVFGAWSLGWGMGRCTHEGLQTTIDSSARGDGAGCLVSSQALACGWASTWLGLGLAFKGPAGAVSGTFILISSLVDSFSDEAQTRAGERRTVGVLKNGLKDLACRQPARTDRAASLEPGCSLSVHREFIMRGGPCCLARRG